MMMISYSGLPNGMNGRQLAPLRAKHEAEERERESSREGEMNNLVLIWLFSDEVFERWCLCCMRYNTAKKGKWKSEKKNQSGLYTHRHTHTRTIFVRKIGKIIKMRKKNVFSPVRYLWSTMKFGHLGGFWNYLSQWARGVFVIARRVSCPLA